MHKPLGERMHRCDGCGLDLRRDTEAARHILAHGLAKAGEGAPQGRPTSPAMACVLS